MTIPVYVAANENVDDCRRSWRRRVRLGFRPIAFADRFRHHFGRPRSGSKAHRSRSGEALWREPSAGARGPAAVGRATTHRAHAVLRHARRLADTAHAGRTV